MVAVMFRSNSAYIFETYQDITCSVTRLIAYDMTAQLFILFCFYY